MAAVAMSSQATTDKFLKKTLSNPTNGRVELILKTARPLTQEDQNDIKRIGGYVYKDLSIIKAVAINVPQRKLKTLLSYSFAKHASSDAQVRKTDAFTVSSSGANTAWHNYGLTGDGVGVAVVDSGIRAGGDMAGRVIGSINFASDSWLFSADDKCGHGTHVGGIIAGDGRKSSGSNYFNTYYGIAPEANLINVRVLDAQGGGRVSTVIAGIAYVIATKPLFNTRVMNLSVGHEVGESYKTDPLGLAVEAAWKSGIVVVCAAGNRGRLSNEPSATADNSGFGTNYGSVESPGNSPYVITVGAMKSTDGNRDNDTIASYSGRGPTRIDFVAKPDIVAAGNQIVSTLANEAFLDRMFTSAGGGVRMNEYRFGSSTAFSNDYFRMSGTSMAAPVVAGAVALMLEKDPSLTPDTVKARLMLSADKWANPDGVGDVFTYGAGYLNIPAALQNTAVATMNAKSAVAERKPDGNVTLKSARCTCSSFWGTGVWDNRAMWGTRAMWGVNFQDVSPNRAMWGTSVWNNSATYEVNGTSADLSGIAIRGEGR